MEPITRRGVLAALTGAALAGTLGGCGLFDEEPTTAPPPHPLLQYLTSTVALAQVYEASLAANPELAGRYGVIRDNHWAHADALATVIRKPAPARGPGTAQAVDKAGLVASEQEAKKSAYEGALTIAGQYAGLLGSIAACRTTHVEGLA